MVPPSQRETLDAVIGRGVSWARRSHHRAVAVLIVDVDGDAPGESADEHTMEAVARRLTEIWNVAALRLGDQFVIVSTAVRSTFDAVSLAKLVARAVPCPVRIGIRFAREGSVDGEWLLRDAQFALDEAQRRSETVVIFSRELCLRRFGAEHAE
jgi:hypothetical protein